VKSDWTELVRYPLADCSPPGSLSGPVTVRNRYVLA
jgi:hypothetical protein